MKRLIFLTFSFLLVSSITYCSDTKEAAAPTKKGVFSWAYRHIFHSSAAAPTDTPAEAPPADKPAAAAAPALSDSGAAADVENEDQYPVVLTREVLDRHNRANLAAEAAAKKANQQQQHKRQIERRSQF